MKKLLAIVAMSAVASLGAQSTYADGSGTWSVNCIKQGPVRCKLGNPLRSLNPTAVAGPGTNDANYPIEARSIPTKANVAENNDMVGVMNFVSLGHQGVIVMEYSGFFENVAGDDIKVIETTWGNQSNSCVAASERAWVEVSEDGSFWTPKQLVCHNGGVDISPLAKGKYVRITDATPATCGVVGDGNDFYDVDGVQAVKDWTGTTVNGLCDHYQGTAQQFAYFGASGQGIVAQRKNFALNATVNDVSFTAAQLANPALRESPQVYNFWSMGFGGYACFQLPRFVPNNPVAGVAEIRIFETTWNNQACVEGAGGRGTYRERALVQTSIDGVTWTPGRLICKDSDFELIPADGAGANYIKLTDASLLSDFGKGDDAFDIDNIYIGEAVPPNTLDLCATETSGGRRALPALKVSESEGGVPETMFALEIVGGNVVSDQVSFLATIAEEGGYTYSVRTHTGQEVIKGTMEGNLYDSPTVDVPTQKLASGVYFLTLSSATGRETVKFIKK